MWESFSEKGLQVLTVYGEVHDVYFSSNVRAVKLRKMKLSELLIRTV
jgi:hypothetical protein